MFFLILSLVLSLKLETAANEVIESDDALSLTFDEKTNFYNITAKETGSVQITINSNASRFNIDSGNATELKISGLHNTQIILKTNSKINFLQLIDVACQMINDGKEEKVSSASLTHASLFQLVTSPIIDKLTCDFYSLKTSFLNATTVDLKTTRDQEDLNVYIESNYYNIKSKMNNDSLEIKNNINLIIDNYNCKVLIISMRQNNYNDIIQMKMPEITFTNNAKECSFKIEAYKNEFFNLTKSTISSSLSSENLINYYGNEHYLNSLYTYKTNIFNFISTLMGYYCLANVESFHLCSFKSQIYYYEIGKEIDELKPSDSENSQIIIHIIDTDETNKPIISSTSLNNTHCFLYGHSTTENQRCSVVIKHNVADIKLKFFHAHNFDLNIVAISPILIDVVDLNRCNLQNAAFFQPLSLIRFDEESSNCVQFINDKIPTVEYTAPATKIIFHEDQITVYGNTILNLSANVCQKLGVLTTSQSIILEVGDLGASQTFHYKSVFIDKEDINDQSELIFGKSWDNYQSTSLTPKIPIKYKNGTLRSVVPTWPSDIFECNFEVICAEGGKYCIYDGIDPSYCLVDFLPIEYYLIPTTNFYKHQTKKTIELYISKLDFIVNVSHSKFINQTHVIITSYTPLMALNYVIDVNLSLDIMYDIHDIEFDITLSPELEKEYFLSNNQLISSHFSSIRNTNGNSLYDYDHLQQDYKGKNGDFYLLEANTINCFGECIILPQSNVKIFCSVLNIGNPYSIPFLLNALYETEQTDSAFYLDTTMSFISLSNNSFCIFMKNGQVFDLTLSFRSLYIYFKDDYYVNPIILIINHTKLTGVDNIVLPNIIADSPEISFQFMHSCYNVSSLNITGKSMISTSNSSFSITFLSTVSDKPPLDSFIIPKESDNIKYDFLPHPTPSFGPTSPSSKGPNSIYLIIILVVISVVIIAITIVCVNAALKKKVYNVSNELLLTATLDLE